METKRKQASKPKDQLLKRIADQEDSDIVAEVWQGTTYGDPEIEYHYYRVVREYPFGKKRLRTDKLLPRHHEASVRVAEIAAAECLKRTRDQMVTVANHAETAR
ncbi:hypothetical protein [Bythopirellula goksoeyrii]|uniref:Uncharacterized protein n=1 Tax=Bythopirellula goksoeyrii TaxID=1400387 RepID=A0A5B9QEZ6_9BACT|nr:hypothetical protein [Bythopirellula goksoeyrii]QEG36082.1 hypothetical protein Pr1d_33910 [Bythopirellula goksoeyrii]